MSDPRNILMDRNVDYFNRFLITGRSRMMSRARLVNAHAAPRGNYVHEAFLETILPIVRLWAAVMRPSTYTFVSYDSPIYTDCN